MYNADADLSLEGLGNEDNYFSDLVFFNAVCYDENFVD